MTHFYSCAVNGCRSNSYTPGIRFFHFKRNVKQCRPWIDFCKNPKLDAMFEKGINLSSSNCRICSLHFKREDYQNELQIRLLMGAKPTLCGPKDVTNDTRSSDNTHLLDHPELACSMNDNVLVRNGATPGKDIINNLTDIHAGDIESHSNSELDEISEIDTTPLRRSYIYRCEADPSHMIEETPELYSFVVLPYLNQECFDLQWVYNLISGTSEQDRVVYESPCKDDKDGFLLIQDLEWDGIALENLHLLAIPYRPGILSLRDLRVNHLPLLRNIHIQGRKAVEDKYGLPVSQLSIFLRYQPSFYHLHVHFTSVSHKAYGIHVGNSHLLSSVISNIELYPNHYQDATIPFCLRESDKLFLQFEEHGVVTKLERALQSS